MSLDPASSLANKHVVVVSAPLHPLDTATRLAQALEAAITCGAPRGSLGMGTEYNPPDLHKIRYMPDIDYLVSGSPTIEWVWDVGGATHCDIVRFLARIGPAVARFGGRPAPVIPGPGV